MCVHSFNDSERQNKREKLWQQLLVLFTKKERRKKGDTKNPQYK